MTTYSGAQRTKGLALWGAVGSLGVAAGVLFGGALTTWAGWQLIFWVNVPIGVVALALGLKVLPKDDTARADLAQFDLPGAPHRHRRPRCPHVRPGQHLRARLALGPRPGRVRGLRGAARRVRPHRAHAARPLVPPHTWKVTTLVSGTTVMLGVTGLLVGTVFLTSIFFQTVLGYSALRAGVAFLPLALAITVGTHVAGKLLARTSPRNIAAGGLALVAVGAALLSLVGSDTQLRDRPAARHARPRRRRRHGVRRRRGHRDGRHPRPARRHGVGFLMTGHEVGAALGVAVLSAVATTAGSLTDPAGVVDAFSAAFVAAAVLAAVVGVVAYLRMPAARMSGAAAMHMHH